MCLSNGGADLPHPLGEIIGGICPRIAHGETLAMVYPSFLKYKKNIAADKFKEVASFIGLKKDPDKLSLKIEELLKITKLSNARERAELTREEKDEILTHPLLSKLEPKNSNEIIAIMKESII